MYSELKETLRREFNGRVYNNQLNSQENWLDLFG